MPAIPCYTYRNSFSDYTAFGSIVTERNQSFGSTYKYGFNNQEKDVELGDYYSFEYRIHDARLGRFLSVDPLSKDYPWNSSYAFAENQVIWAIDLEGREAWKVNGGEGIVNGPYKNQEQAQHAQFEGAVVEINSVSISPRSHNTLNPHNNQIQSLRTINLSDNNKIRNVHFEFKEGQLPNNKFLNAAGVSAATEFDKQKSKAMDYKVSNLSACSSESDATKIFIPTKTSQISETEFIKNYGSRPIPSFAMPGPMPEGPNFIQNFVPIQGTYLRNVQAEWLTSHGYKTAKSSYLWDVAAIVLPEIIGGESLAAMGGANFTFKELSSFRGTKSADVSKWLEQNGWSGVKTNPNRVYNDGMRFTNGVKGEQIRIMTGGATRSIPAKTGPYMEISINGQKSVIELFGNPTLK